MRIMIGDGMRFRAGRISYLVGSLYPFKKVAIISSRLYIPSTTHHHLRPGTRNDVPLKS